MLAIFALCVGLAIVLPGVTRPDIALGGTFAIAIMVSFLAVSMFVVSIGFLWLAGRYRVPIWPLRFLAALLAAASTSVALLAVQWSLLFSESGVAALGVAAVIGFAHARSLQAAAPRMAGS